MAKTEKKTKEIRLEDILFNCRDQLRGRAPMTDKRDLLLTLVFLKFVGDRFMEQQAKIAEQFKDDPNFTTVRGISINKVIIETKADMTGVSLTPYKLLKPQEFAFVTVTSRNGEKISLAENTTANTFIVSSSYEVFRIKDKENLLPDFLYLWFSRPEFDRYARFNSWGSARETFSFSEMCRVKIPLPPIEVQKAIVAIYRCAQENKAIAGDAAALSKSICPVLMRQAMAGGAQ